MLRILTFVDFQLKELNESQKCQKLLLSTIDFNGYCLQHETSQNLMFFRGGSRIWLRGGPEIFWLIFADSVQLSHANKVIPYWPGSRAHLRALEALKFFITKYAFSPFWGTFLYYFSNNKVLIFLDKLSWQTFLYTGIQILDQMYMYLFLKNYFLFKYQSIMHKYHYAMFMINVHCIMYNLYEAMKIKWTDAWIHLCIRQWRV